MQSNILVCKAFCLERLVQRIMGHMAAVHRQKDALAAAIVTEGHIVTQPALHTAALVIIAAGAFRRVLFTALKAVDIELPHIVADPLEAFDQFTVSHMIPPFL